MAQPNMRMAMNTLRQKPADRRQERWSDCWPDWNTSVEDAEVIKALAEKNSPRVVFAEIGRVLSAIAVAIVAVDIALGAFHIH
jgi:hypothetical protein